MGAQLSSSPAHRVNLSLRDSERKRQSVYVSPSSVTFSLALAAYLTTLAPDLSWAHFAGDGGELITAAVTLGVPHPPGYPTYVILGKLVSLIPIGSVAYRFNLLSAVCVAVASGFVAATVQGVLGGDQRRQLSPAFVAAFCAGLAVAYSALVWSQAIVAEVYGLNLALTAVFLWSTLGRRRAWQSGLFLGLAITAHLTSLLLLPVAILLSRADEWREFLTGLAVGLVPLLALPLLARSGSPVIWGNPATITGWLWTVSGRLYQGNAFALDRIDWSARLAPWGRMLLAQYTAAGPFLIALGLLRSNGFTRRQKGALLLASGMFVAYALSYDSLDSAVYLLPGLLILGILLGLGMGQFGYISLLLPAALLLLNFADNDLSNDYSLRASSQQLLAMVPEEAILLTPGDATIFALWYYQHVEQQRQDIVLVDRNLFAFDWYRLTLKERYPALGGLVEDDLETFRMANQFRIPYCDGAIVPVNGKWRPSGSCVGATNDG